MISLPSTVQIFLCTRDVDLRKSFDGLSGLVHDCFGQDPLCGHLFLFLNRRSGRVAPHQAAGICLRLRKFSNCPRVSQHPLRRDAP